MGNFKRKDDDDDTGRVDHSLFLFTSIDIMANHTVTTHSGSAPMKKRWSLGKLTSRENGLLSSKPQTKHGSSHRLLLGSSGSEEESRKTTVEMDLALSTTRIIELMEDAFLASTHKEDLGRSSSTIIDPVEEDFLEQSPTEDETSSTNSSGCLKLQSQPISLTDTSGSDSAMSSRSPVEKKKSVSWDTVEFQVHEIVLGDNPATSTGPPLSIGWKIVGIDSLPIDSYEEYRALRRCRSELIVPSAVRQRMLMEAGYSRAELDTLQGRLRKIKRSRRASATVSLLEKARNIFRSKRSIAGTIQNSGKNLINDYD
jgi:hypothetical protein